MDASNFLSFLQILRADPKGADLVLSAATSIKPWNGQDGNPLSDVSQFASVLDHIGVYASFIRSSSDSPSNNLIICFHRLKLS